jgi:hypothetical protein
MSAASLRLTDREWLEQAGVYVEAREVMTKDDWLYLANEAEADNRPLIAHSMLMQALSMEEQPVPVPVKVLSRRPE